MGLASAVGNFYQLVETREDPVEGELWRAASAKVVRPTLFKGVTICTKFDEFSENYVALFSRGPKICNEIHSDWRDPPPFFRKFIVFTAPKFPEKPQRNFSDRK